MKYSKKMAAKVAAQLTLWQRPVDDGSERCPPRSKPPLPPPGQDFDSLTGRYGRPRGPFEPEPRKEDGRDD